MPHTCTYTFICTHKGRLTLPVVCVLCVGFGGCIANLTLNKRTVDLSTVRDLVNINLDGCPPFHVPEKSCQDSLVTEVYRGPQTIAYERGLMPYTGEYLVGALLLFVKNTVMVW